MKAGRALFVLLFFVLAALVVAGAHAAGTPPPSPTTPEAVRSPLPELDGDRLASIAPIVEDSIRRKEIPGAVVIVGSGDRVVYRRAFGRRAVLPQKEPMTEDTIFDVASVTKGVATATAVMQLAERGSLSVDDAAAKYWPEFGSRGKEKITIRQLLTHHSGLRADLEASGWHGYGTAMAKLAAEKPVYRVGATYLYGDINFEILGEIVRRVSGMTLDRWCAENIFAPLGMKDTFFTPEDAIRPRIAPTQFRRGKILRGEVHDPNAWSMEGVAGHAGLFSTADDLARFARMMLSGGALGDARILKASTVEEMTTVQSPPRSKEWRGFGWDIVAPLVANREDLPPAGAYDHTGYTGTALWIDPVTRTYLIALTNRVHPNGSGTVKELRARLVAAVSEALGPLTPEEVVAARPTLRGLYEKASGARAGKIAHRASTAAGD